MWQLLARLAGADQLHVSGLGSKFYERDEEVAWNIRELLARLGDTIPALPVLSSGQNVMTPGLTYSGLGSTDVLMLAGGIAAHPAGPAAGVRSLRDAWSAATEGVPLAEAAARHARCGDDALLRAIEKFG